MISIAETVEEMVNSLMDEAKEFGVNLSGMTIDNFNEFLDDAFDDGGEVRCERFTDLAMPYALQYGPMESGDWDDARWECIEKAIAKIQEQL